MRLAYGKRPRPTSLAVTTRSVTRGGPRRLSERRARRGPAGGPEVQEDRPVRGSAERDRAFLGLDPRARLRLTPARRPARPRLACSGCAWHSWAAVAWARRSRSACSTAAGSPRTLAIAEVDAERRHALEARLPGVRVVPQPGVGRGRRRGARARGEAGRRGRRAGELRRVLPDGALVLSIAAGVTIAALEAARPGDPSCGRCRTPARSSAAAPPPSRAGTHADELDLEVGERVLGAVGIVVRVPESQLDAVTGLSGSGPGVCVPARRGDDRSGRARRSPARHRGARPPDAPRRGHAARRRRRDSRVAARRGHVTGRHHRRRSAVLEAHGVRAAILDAVDAAATSRPRSSGQGVSRAAVVAPAAQAPRPARPRGPSAPTAGPNPRELLKQQHVAGRSPRFGRDEVARHDAARRHGAPNALLRAPAVPESHAGAGRGRGRARVRLGGRRPTRPHRAGVHRRRFHRRVHAHPRSRARAAGGSRSRPRARRRCSQLYRRLAARAAAEGGEVLDAHRDRRRSVPAVGACGGSTASRCSPTAPRLLADDTVDAADELLFTLARPDLVVADRSLRRGGAGPGPRGGGVRRPRRGRAGRRRLAGPGRADRAPRRAPAPRAYAGSSSCSRARRRRPRSTRFGGPRMQAADDRARSCSFATRAAQAYAHPAEKRGIRKG